jgi:nucleolar protein 15
VEFAAASVARIVADTMDNYLMFGHILKCKFVPQDQIHEQLWKGANRRFKKTPWNRIEKGRLEAGKTRNQWSKKIEQEEQKRAAQVEKMKALGYELEMPKLKGVDEVHVKDKEANPIESAQRKTEGAELEKIQAIESPGDVKEPYPENNAPNGAVQKDKEDKKIAKKIEGANTAGGQQSQVKAAPGDPDVPKTKSKKSRKDAVPKDTAANIPVKVGKEGKPSKIKKSPAAKLEKTEKSKMKKTKA